jgi:hypothetical protein
MTEQNLTERQQKWFKSVRDSLERDTGNTLEEWVAIAKSCPETGQQAQLKWFKENHGLLQNRAMHVLNEASGAHRGWEDADALIAALWRDADSRAILEAIGEAASALPGVIRTARKGYTAWSRRVQFAALRPVKGGKAMLGLAVLPDADPRLSAPRSESWSERLKARMPLASPADVDDGVRALLKAAWQGA